MIRFSDASAELAAAARKCHVALWSADTNIDAILRGAPPLNVFLVDAGLRYPALAGLAHGVLHAGCDRSLNALGFLVHGDERVEHRRGWERDGLFMHA